MLCFMQHLEIHVLETETDIDLALQSGILTVDQLGHTECSECSSGVAYSGEAGFEPFLVVINEHDQDWPVCLDCASPVLEQVPSKGHTSYEMLIDDELEDLEDLENF